MLQPVMTLLEPGGKKLHRHDANDEPNHFAATAFCFATSGKFFFGSSRCVFFWRPPAARHDFFFLTAARTIIFAVTLLAFVMTDKEF